MLVNGLNLDIGTIIKFTTINPKDPVRWQGAIAGFNNYDVASGITDLAAYHQQITQTQLDPVETLQYIIIREVTTNRLMAFAIDWISPASLQIITPGTNLDIRIYNTDESSLNTILQLLQDNGYSCKAI